MAEERVYRALDKLVALAVSSRNGRSLRLLKSDAIPRRDMS